jgi:hypothetical protein
MPAHNEPRFDLAPHVSVRILFTQFEHIFAEKTAVGAAVRLSTSSVKPSRKASGLWRPFFAILCRYE